MKKPAISYVRVYERQQRLSGLDRPEVQRWAIAQFAEAEGFEIVAKFVEVADRQGDEGLDNRPELKAAIDEAGKIRAPVIVAKLDRLGTDTAIVSSLMMHGVQFIVAGAGIDSEPFMLGRFPGETETDRRLKGARIKAALKAAQARGVVLGKHGRDVLAPANRKAALERAQALAHIVEPKLAAGKSLRTIADELNEEGVATPRGGRWHLASVQRLVSRLAIARPG